ncbi:MAG: hypothetical protein SFV24_00955 [Gemmatimonadales bacterium]|nr:hypothetical protein [Gemmatimonadales bacterium]
MPPRHLLLGLALTALACAAPTDVPDAPDTPAGVVGPQLGPPPTTGNVAPVLLISAPGDGDAFAAGAPVTVTGDFTDADAADTHSCSIDWQLAATAGTVTEASGAGSCVGSFSYPTPGTYTIVLAVIDNAGNSSTDTVSVSITQAAPPPPPPPPPAPSPNAGSVRGDGFASLQPGTLAKQTRRPPTIWLAVNSWVSQHSNNPRGAVEIVVPNADLRLRSSAVERLLVTGSKAEIRGRARLNKKGEYQFLVMVLDGSRIGRERRDRVRVKVWNAAGVLIDTDPGAPDDREPKVELTRGRIHLRP